MKVYEVDDCGRIEEVGAESFEEAAEVWMAKFTPEEESGTVFVTDTTIGLRRKVVVYAEKNITYTYYARIIE